MKTLLLVRHAKSDWDHPELTDFERPLNKRGYRDAPFMAEWLAEQDVPVPDQLVSSPAERARTTAQHFADALKIPADQMQFEPRIYEASTADLRTVAEHLDDALQTVMMVGHNPGMTEFAEYLTRSPIGNMPTCAICQITLPIDSWQEITSGTGNLDFYVFPKALR